MFSSEECCGSGGASSAEVDDRSLKWSRAVDFQAGSPEKKRDELTRELLLISLYRVVDTNGDGFLQLSELTKMMSNADVFMQVADTDSDGKMSQDEFMEWSRVNIVTYLSNEDVDRMNKMLQLASVARQENGDGESMFKAFDLNGDGQVNLSEIKEVLTGDAEQVLKCFTGISKDGVVDKPSFLTWAEGDDENFNMLKKHLRGVDAKATKALLNLYSKVAVSLAQTKTQKPSSPPKMAPLTPAATEEKANPKKV
jgi:Ca2+-binding EF-hand superfamily protein